MNRHAVARLRVIYRVEPVIAGVALLVLAPLVLAVAAILLLLARGCPLVRHVRVGRDGSNLRMLKFRTMWQQGSRWTSPFAIREVRDSVPLSKTARDPRVTSRFAAWCRRHSLDELPQLYHVMRGEMSLVGPRPITRHELNTYYSSCAAEVLSVRPGLTGLWQVKGRSRLSYERRRRLDLLLVRRVSARLYLYILFRSMPNVLWGADAY